MMKGKMKGIVSLVLSLVMMLSLSFTSVNAVKYDTTNIETDRDYGIINIIPGESGEKANSKYSLYRVLDTVTDAGQDVYEYKYAKNFENFDKQKLYSVADIAKLANGSDDYVIDTNTVDRVASSLENFVKENTDNLKADYELSVGQPTMIKLGYYLILETTITNGTKQTKPMLVAVPQKVNGKYNYEVEVALKDQPITTTKTIEESETKLKDSIAQQIGKTITFKVVQDVPVYDDSYKNITFKVTDSLSQGLTFKEVVSVKADNTELNTNQYRFYDPSNQNGTNLVFDFSGDNYKNVKDAKQVIITYTAVLNENANFGQIGNTNEVYPTFGDNDDTITNGEKDVTVNYVGEFTLRKLDNETSAFLQGAEFTVYTDEECTTEAALVTYELDGDGIITAVPNTTLSATAVTDADGAVKFSGLGAGTYYIKETKAPSGYVRLKSPIKVDVAVKLPEEIKTGEEKATFTYTVSGNGVSEKTITQNGNSVSFEVVNAKGFELPTTGGMGTYALIAGGVVLVVIAGVLFVRSRRDEM